MLNRETWRHANWKRSAEGSPVLSLRGRGGERGSLRSPHPGLPVPDLPALPQQLQQLRIVFPGTIHINVLHSLVGLVGATCFYKGHRCVLILQAQQLLGLPSPWDEP